MLTKDFVKEVEKLGLECSDCSTIIPIYHDGDLVSLVSKNTKFLAGTVYNSFRYLPKELQEKLYNLIDEYARTPIEDREEQQKYFLIFAALTDNEHFNYLNHNLKKDFLALSDRNQSDMYQTQFTQKEIDEIKEKFNVTLSDFEQIPIEEVKDEG